MFLVTWRDVSQGVYCDLSPLRSHMEDRAKLVSFQKEIAYDVIIKNYSFLVGHLNAIRIFPQLVSSRVVEPDFCQRLDCRQTDRDKMIALLHELVRCTEETWFDRFTNALSKVPQYEKVADKLLEGNCPCTHTRTFGTVHERLYQMTKLIVVVQIMQRL